MISGTNFVNSPPFHDFQKKSIAIWFLVAEDIHTSSNNLKTYSLARGAAKGGAGGAAAPPPRFWQIRRRLIRNTSENFGLHYYTTKNISDKLRCIKELLGVFGTKLLGAP